MSTQANPHLETDHIVSLDRGWWGNKSGVSVFPYEREKQSYEFAEFVCFQAPRKGGPQ